MGAPNTAYFNNGNTFSEQHKVAVATRDILFPLFAAAYPTPTAFKEKFYCDYLLEFLEKKDALGNIQTVMVAAVIPNGTNADMHADNRFSNVELWVKRVDNSLVKVLVLNDGSLHTRGLASVVETVSPVFTAFTVKFNFKSAFYIPSSEYGVLYRWRNEADTAWESWNAIYFQSSLGEIAADASSVLTHLVPINRPTTHLILAQIKAFFTNSEGTKEGDIVTLHPTLKPIQLQLNSWTNSPTTYWVNDDEIIAGGNESTLTGLWANSDMSGGRYTTNMQLWKDARYYYTYGYNVPEDVWCFLSLVDSDPPDPEPTYIEYDFVFFKSDTNLTIEQISDEMMASPTGPGWISGKIYSPLSPSPNEGKWYTTNALTTLVSNGWYVQGNNGIGATKAYKIISGEVEEEWDNH